jgi:serine/threonine protein kinase
MCHIITLLLIKTIDGWEGPESVVRFNIQDIANATKDFSVEHEIGVGGFGKVFYGVLDGKEVAIKRAHQSSIQTSSGFRNEILLLSRLHHRNLVRLVGFCEEKGIQVKPFPFMHC